jgi:hypothetical protein
VKALPLPVSDFLEASGQNRFPNSFRFFESNPTIFSLARDHEAHCCAPSDLDFGH